MAHAAYSPTAERVRPVRAFLFFWLNVWSFFSQSLRGRCAETAHIMRYLDDWLLIDIASDLLSVVIMLRKDFRAQGGFEDKGTPEMYDLFLNHFADLP